MPSKPSSKASKPAFDGRELLRKLSGYSGASFIGFFPKGSPEDKHRLSEEAVEMATDASTLMVKYDIDGILFSVDVDDIINAYADPVREYSRVVRSAKEDAERKAERNKLARVPTLEG